MASEIQEPSSPAPEGEPNTGGDGRSQRFWVWIGKGAAALAVIYYGHQLYKELFPDRPNLVAYCYKVSSPFSPTIPEKKGGLFLGLALVATSSGASSGGPYLPHSLSICRIENTGNQSADEVKVVLADTPISVEIGRKGFFSSAEVIEPSKSITLGALGAGDEREVRIWHTGTQNLSITLFHKSGTGNVYHGKILFGWIASVAIFLQMSEVQVAVAGAVLIGLVSLILVSIRSRVRRGS